MANPQDPGLRRSGNVPALNPDAVEAEIEARKVKGGPHLDDPEELVAEPDVPEAVEQDKPDPADVADLFGLDGNND